MNYYNEFDPKAAAWLRALIDAGEIPPGHVDERSISDVSPSDLRGFIQCHFFAGIGGWSYALKLAGWPDTRHVWTGSCPCQPFSAAGKQKGNDDERHLWPVFFGLIAACHPERIFGEQVASAVGFGWLDGVSADLEGKGYAVGAAVLGAHSVGAPHIRQRLYWMADATGSRPLPGAYTGIHSGEKSGGARDVEFERCGSFGRLADSPSERRHGRPDSTQQDGRSLAQDGGASGRLEHAASNGREQWGAEPSGGRSLVGCGVGDRGGADSLRDGALPAAGIGRTPRA